MLRNHRRAIRAVALVAGAGLALALVPTGAATAHSAQSPHKSKHSCERRTNNTVAKLLACVDADGARQHLKALQHIADANDDNRAAGTPGYEASVRYVTKVLRSAGWKATIDEFPLHLRRAVHPRAAHPRLRHLPHRSVHRQRGRAT